MLPPLDRSWQPLINAWLNQGWLSQDSTESMWMNLIETMPDLLLACLRQTPPNDLAAQLAKLSPEQWQQLLDLSVEQSISALLYHRLKSHGHESAIPAEVRQALQKKYYGNALRNMRLYQEVGKLTAALNAQDVAAIILKGAYLAATVYETIALRTMVDIDIMVKEADLPAAIEQIQTLGYEPVEPLLALNTYLDYNHHLPPFVHPNAVASVEIHWTITRPQRAYSIPMQELWARSRGVTLVNATTQSFCPEDLLLHVCMHATYHHWFQQGVRSLCDIDEIVGRYGNELDWEAIIQRATAWEWQRGVYLALITTAHMLGTPIPAHVLQKLNAAEEEQLDPAELQAILFPKHRDLLNSPTGYFLNFLNDPRISAKLTVFRQRLFLSRKEMAVKYAIDPASPWLYFYYPIRLKDLAGSFAHQAWRMWRGDPDMVTVAGQQDKLQRWLEQV